jgi:hypothetical protein
MPCHAMPVIDRQPTNSKCLLARMQSTAAPLSVVVHITAGKNGTKSKEEGAWANVHAAGERAAHFTDPFLTYPFPAPTAAFLDFNNRHHIKQGTQKPTSSTRPLKSRNPISTQIYPSCTLLAQSAALLLPAVPRLAAAVAR